MTMLSELRSVPYWRLSSFYFFNCAVLGAILPYWGLYLQELGFSATQIGSVGAILMATNIVAPNLWGWISDYTGRRLLVIRGGIFLACFSFLGIFYVDSFIGFAVLTGCCSFCWQGLNSQFEVITLGHLSGRTQYYGHIRLWGSVGFVAAVASLGLALDYMSIHRLPYVVLSLLICMWFSTLSVSGAGSASGGRESGTGLAQVVRQPVVWGLLLSVTLLQLSHGAYYTFYSLYLDSYGYSKATIGGLWALAVIAEVLMFLVMYKVVMRISLRGILAFGMAVAAVRWGVIAAAPDALVVLIAAQLCHAFTFTAVHVAVIEFIRRHFGSRYQGQGQALYCSLCIGAGGALGAMLSGRSWEWSGAGTFGFAALAAALGLWVTWRWVYPLPRESDEQTLVTEAK
ncbi:MFS transporter [Exilibacterium tricleocarpae]|uniref:MFS transporter n=1 Tax=Exilibacterium tricleocarpae TaxID=2591008 RepID=A0A545U9U1_9GAMM|nr:MFS transporter [Exilibacterium tricleocarpae]TQV86242.1 MFS transporter [Exilibacterium tricleocarpae]